MDVEWTYPVFSVFPQCIFHVYDTHSEFTLGDKRSVRKKIYTGSEFVDPSLGLWRVVGAEFAGYRPWFSEWPRYTFDRPGTVRFQTEFLGYRSIIEVSEWLCASIDYEIDMSEEESVSLKAGLRSATSFADLIRQWESEL